MLSTELIVIYILILAFAVCFIYFLVYFNKLRFYVSVMPDKQFKKAEKHPLIGEKHPFEINSSEKSLVILITNPTCASCKNSFQLIKEVLHIENVILYHFIASEDKVEIIKNDVIDNETKKTYVVIDYPKQQLIDLGFDEYPTYIYSENELIVEVTSNPRRIYYLLENDLRKEDNNK